MADDWISETLGDLAAMRVKLDQIAARLESHRAAVELRPAPPLYSCGHRHRNRDEAAMCLREQAARVVEIPHEGVVT